MKFSILTPTFNRLEMLKQAIKSVQEQTYTDWELIIKDGFTENPAINDIEFASIIAKDERILYILEGDTGITDALNQALRVSIGDIICEMNDDDLLYDNSVLERVKNAFGESLDGEKWLYAKMIYIDVEGKEGGAGGRQTSLQELLQNNTVCQPTVFWNRIASGKVGYFDENFSFAQDYDYWIRLWKLKEPIFLDEFVARYRLHEGSITSSRNAEQSADAQRVREKHQ